MRREAATETSTATGRRGRPSSLLPQSRGDGQLLTGPGAGRRTDTTQNVRRFSDKIYL